MDPTLERNSANLDSQVGWWRRPSKQQPSSLTHTLGPSEHFEDVCVEGMAGLQERDEFRLLGTQFADNDWMRALPQTSELTCNIDAWPGEPSQSGSTSLVTLFCTDWDYYEQGVHTPVPTAPLEAASDRVHPSLNAIDHRNCVGISSAPVRCEVCGQQQSTRAGARYAIVI